MKLRHPLPSVARILLLLAGCACLALAQVQGAETYLINDLGTLGGVFSRARALNNAGVVAGEAALADGSFHGVILSNNVMVDLGTLGGSNSAALALSADHHVAGWAQAPGSGAQRAFLQQGGEWVDLGGLLSNSTNSVAHGVNSAGTVVGEFRTANGRSHPFVYANGILSLGFEGAAKCINDVGDIGGFEHVAGKAGIIITGGQRVYVGTLGSNDTEVVGLNTNRLAVGRSLTTLGHFRAFAFQDGRLQDLGTLGGKASAALGVNNAGIIVGQAENKEGATRAFVYRRGLMIDLNTMLPPESGWELTTAAAINDTGQIAGWGQVNGETHGFLLTPNFLELALYPGVTIAGRVGRRYRIEYLDALGPAGSWQVLTNLILTTSPTLLIDPRPASFANRLYRSVLVP